MAMHTTVKAHRAGGSRAVDHMHIEPAENGYIAKTRYKAEPGDEKKMMMDYDANSETHVLKDHKALAKHVAEKFGGGKAEAKEEKKEGKKDSKKEEKAEHAGKMVQDNDDDGE